MLEDQLEAKSVQGGSRGCFPPALLPKHTRRGESHPVFWNRFSHEGARIGFAVVGLSHKGMDLCSSKHRQQSWGQDPPNKLLR